MKLVLFKLLISMALVVGESVDAIPQKKPNFFVRLLAEQLSGDVADYNNAKPEWQPILESRIRYTIFTYWINVAKFKLERFTMIERRFGELAVAIEKNKAFDRTFIEPYFVKSSEQFPEQGYVSELGERFVIKSEIEFHKENKEFLRFLETCVKLTTKRD